MDKPVFLTGASGFIARHILLELLRRGHRVRAGVRTDAKAEHVRASMARHLGAAFDPDRLGFVHLDLMRDEGWSEALEGCAALIHTASPVPMAQPENEAEVIAPAVHGTERALKAAAGAGALRVVLTSSVAAISGEVPTSAEARYDESDWTDLDLPGLSPYAKSKTLAERAAWDLAAAHGLSLTTVNPVFVFGPPLDEDFGASLGVIRRILKGRDPMLPKVSFFAVDVRDVAALHVAALDDPATVGQRIIAGSAPLTMMEIADILRAEYPGRKIASRAAPNWLVRLLALRDKPLRFIVPALGRRTIYDTARMRAVLGRDPIPAADAVRATARYLVEGGHA